MFLCSGHNPTVASQGTKWQICWLISYTRTAMNIRFSVREAFRTNLELQIEDKPWTVTIEASLPDWSRRVAVASSRVDPTHLQIPIVCECCHPKQFQDSHICGSKLPGISNQPRHFTVYEDHQKSHYIRQKCFSAVDTTPLWHRRERNGRSSGQFLTLEQL